MSSLRDFFGFRKGVYKEGGKCDSYYQEHLQIVVGDHGKGFDPAVIDRFDNKSGGGFGLISIRERILSLNGRFDIDSEIGKGTKFTMIVPLKSDETEETATRG